MLSNVSLRVKNSRMASVFFVTVVVFVCIPACSTKSMYNDIQANQRYRCLALPESEQASCFSSLEMSYEDYQRERQALKKTKRNQ